MSKRKQTRSKAITEHISNVVDLFPRPKMIDPLENELLLEACRDWFSRGDISPSGKSTKYVADMSEQDYRDYGMLAPVLLARSPCSYKTHEDIYLRFLTDGRLPRICQYAFCAYINSKKLTRTNVNGFLGIVGAQLTALTRKSTDDCVDVLIGMKLIEEVDGELRCTRKLGYYVIEMIMFFANAMQKFATIHHKNMATAWNALEGEAHSTYWLPITAPLERKNGEKLRDQK
jgi:hypothetical protein